MHVYFNSKILSVQSAAYIEGHKKNQMQLRSVANCIFVSRFNLLFQPGTRVTIYISGVPQEAANKDPVTLFSLFQHEHKNTVLHFTIQRNTEYDGSVRSKVIIFSPITLARSPIPINVGSINSVCWTSPFGCEPGL